ncbi:MAG: peptidylprolyl isomerase [Eubacterium sp.]|nr:peptidylprolyl isomerase [Eubacterium sp.]
MEKDTEKKVSRIEAKAEKARAQRDDINKQLEEIKTQILEEKDEKEKQKLRKKRDALIARKDGIVITDEKVKVPMSSAAKKGLTSCIAIVLVIALLFAYVATGFAKKGFISSLGWPQKALTGMVVTDADGKNHNIKVCTYNYYFAVYYNNLKQSQQYMAQYGVDDSSEVDFEKAFAKQETEDEDGKKITWAQKAEKTVLDNIKEVYGYYYAAVKANGGKEPEITEEQQKELDETLDSYKDSAKEYGFTLSAYLMAAMGDGVDAVTFTREATVAYIAENYQENYQKDLSEKEYTEDEYKAYLKEHNSELEAVDVKYFEATNADDAKSFVDELSDDGSNFAELAAKYADEDDKDLYKNESETLYTDATRAVFTNLNGAISKAETKEKKDDNAETEETYPGFDWLFSDKRKAGDKKAYSTSVVYIVKPARVSDTKTVNVRHILIQPEKKDEDGNTSNINLSEANAKQRKAAKKKADKVLAEYKSGKKTEEAFGNLAKKYSSDGNANDGGLYENVIPNQMVSSFNDWCFDASRKSGDVAIVETEFGYHVIYFVSQGDIEAWKYTAQQTMASQTSTTDLDKIKEDVKIKKAYPGACYFEVDTDIDN